MERSCERVAGYGDSEQIGEDRDAFGILLAVALRDKLVIEENAQISKQHSQPDISEKDIVMSLGGVPMIRTSNIPQPAREWESHLPASNEMCVNQPSGSNSLNLTHSSQEASPSKIFQESLSKKRYVGRNATGELRLAAKNHINRSSPTMPQIRGRKRRRALTNSDYLGNEDETGLVGEYESDMSSRMQDQSSPSKTRPRKRRKASAPQDSRQRDQTDPRSEEPMGLMQRKKVHEAKREEFKAALAARRKRDDDLMYEGLKNFKGSQRGWNGQHPSEIRKALQAEEDRQRQEQGKQSARRRVAEEAESRRRNAALGDNSLLRLPTRTDREYEEWFGQAMSLREISRIQTLDAVQQIEEDAYRHMMSRPFDHHQIGLQVRKERRAAEAVSERARKSSQLE